MFFVDRQPTMRRLLVGTRWQKKTGSGYNRPEIGRGMRDVCQSGSLRCLHNQQGVSARGISGGEREKKN